MFAWLYFLIRLLIWVILWPLRALRKAPGYVVVDLKPGMPLLDPVRRGWRRYVSGPRKLSMWRLNDRLSRLSRRSEVRGVLVLLRPGDFGAVQAESIHSALAAFQQTGREVVVWTKGLDLRRLAIASAATRLVLAPGGSVGPLGMHRDMLYFGEALTGLGIELDVVQSGPHKSAYEPLTASAPSAEVSEMLGWLFDGIFGATCTLIAKGRGVNEATVHEWVDEGLMTDERALERGVVDALAGEAETIHALSEGAKRPPRLTPLDRVEGLFTPPPQRPGRPGVAVLRVEGAIVDGVSRRPPVGLPVRGLAQRCGDLTLIAQCRQLAAAKRVKAVVLFIDSPGGSASASEAMAEALGELAANKPLIAVMGSTAASGGYYVATAARKVVASQTTLTGSIGVIMAKVVNAGLLARLNVNSHAVARGEQAGMFTSSQPFSDAERALLTAHMERTYSVFVDRVAAARAMTPEVVDGFGRGRVWTGAQAVDRGLVDAIGGFAEAVDMARALTSLPSDAPLLEPSGSRDTWRPPGAHPDAPGPSSFGAAMQWLSDGAGWVSSPKPLALSQVIWRPRGE